MRGKKLIGRFANVIPRSIMDEKQVLGGVGQNHLHERLVTFRGESAFNTLIEQAPREIRNRTKDLVAFALTTSGDLGLLAAAGPRIT
jgi:hypothetical protein